MSTKSWRDSRDYRSYHFRKSPGLLGFIWFCSQCGIPLLGKKNVEVDHIYPPSKFAVKKVDRHGKVIKNDSILARAMNTGFNTVSICKKCNRKKSDKVGLVTAKGIIAKIIEKIIFTTQKIIVVVVAYFLKVLFLFLRWLWSMVSRSLKSNQPWYIKAVLLIFYCSLVVYAFITIF